MLWPTLHFWSLHICVNQKCWIKTRAMKLKEASFSLRQGSDTSCNPEIWPLLIVLITSYPNCVLWTLLCLHWSFEVSPCLWPWLSPKPSSVEIPLMPPQCNEVSPGCLGSLTRGLVGGWLLARGLAGGWLLARGLAGGWLMVRGLAEGWLLARVKLCSKAYNVSKVTWVSAVGVQ